MVESNIAYLDLMNYVKTMKYTDDPMDILTKLNELYHKCDIIFDDRTQTAFLELYDLIQTSAYTLFEFNHGVKLLEKSLNNNRHKLLTELQHEIDFLRKHNILRQIPVSQEWFEQLIISKRELKPDSW
jgi:hypothetical protein